MLPFGLSKYVATAKRRATLFGLALALTGCQGDPRNSVWFENANAEKRFLEQQLYDWQYECDRLEEENEHLKEQLDEALDKPGKSGGSKRGSGRTRRNSQASPELELDLEAPEIDMGTPAPRSRTSSQKSGKAGDPVADPAQDSLAPANSSPAPDADSEPGKLPEPPKTSSLPTHRGKIVPAADRNTDEITDIYLNPFLTKGVNLDGQPGDDGLAVVIEPRGRQGNYIPQAAPISLVLLDPALQGTEARLARWDFDLVTASRFVRDPAQGRGLFLSVKFPTTPQHARLKLVVRYQLPEGRKLEQWQDLTIDLPGANPERWSPKSSGRETTAAELPPESGQAVPATAELPTLEPPEQLRTWTVRNQSSRPTWQPVR